MKYLFIAVAAQIAIIYVMKVSENRDLNRYGINVGNYLIGTLFALVFTKGGQVIPVDRPLFFYGLAGLNGALYVICLLLQQVNIRYNGTSLSAMYFRLGLVVPILFSWIIFGEKPGPWTFLGILLGIFAIILINGSKEERKESEAYYLLPVLLLGGGSVDVVAKVYSSYGPQVLYDKFILVTFIAALIFALVLFFWKRGKLGRREFLVGAVIGVPNQVMNVSILRAAGILPAYLVFPLYSISVIMGILILNYLFFRERLTRRQGVGVLFLIAALIFMNLLS